MARQGLLACCTEPQLWLDAERLGGWWVAALCQQHEHAESRRRQSPGIEHVPHQRGSPIETAARLPRYANAMSAGLN